MIVTFPHMGPLHVVLKTLLSGLDLTVLPPPPITKKTVELGAKYAPETACLPLKVTLGNFIEALDAGADTIITCGGVGPCRLGYYAEVQKEILQELGYRFKMLTIEPSLIDVVKILRQLTPDTNWLKIYRSFTLAGAKMSTLDMLGEHLRQIRPREKVSGTADGIYCDATQKLAEMSDNRQIQEIGEAYAHKLTQVEQNERQVLKIGLVGEIYVMLENFVNQDIEHRLGLLGVEVHRSMSLTDYVRTHVFKKKIYLDKYAALIGAAAPYLGHSVGGHGVRSVGATVSMAQQGFDGIVHVFPFTCMPEIIAKNILPQASSECSIPVLSLTFDEQSGEAGVLTRLEAFVDLLRYRQQTMPAR